MGLLRKLWRTIKDHAPEAGNLSPAESLYRRMMDSCPECDMGPEYMSGPEGGISINVFCSWCGQGYNVTPIVATAEKIHRSERYITHAKK